jgi:zinc protease
MSRSGTLPNGVRYYIRENRRPEKRAELRLAVNAGSILEDDAQQGLAHFVEHMAFNGTRNFEKQELVGYLESIGMRFGSHLNAYTSFDETVYMLQVPTDSLRSWPRRSRSSRSGRTSSRSTRRDRQGARRRAGGVARLGSGRGRAHAQAVLPDLFRTRATRSGCPSARPTCSSSFARDEAVRFYRDWYRPDLMAVIAVGDFDKAEVER